VAPNIKVSLLIERWRLASNITSRCLASLRVGTIVTSKRDARHRSSSCQVDGSNFFVLTVLVFVVE
jgi:hypothetical protein